jgi:hypothetical protein
MLDNDSRCFVLSVIRQPLDSLRQVVKLGGVCATSS